MSNKFSISMEDGVRLEAAGCRNNCRHEVLDWLCKGDNMRTVADIMSGRGIVTLQEGDYGVFADLGNIRVPSDYDHATWIRTFLERHGKRFDMIPPDVNDTNFSHPSWILKAGEKFRVRIFHQFELGVTSAFDRFMYLHKQNVAFTGFQGLALVFEKMRARLPKCCHVVSYDTAEHLPALDGSLPALDGRSDSSAVPYMTSDDSRVCNIGLGRLQSGWAQSYYMLGLTPI